MGILRAWSRLSGFLERGPDTHTHTHTRMEQNVSSLIKSAIYYLFLLRRLKKLRTPSRELVNIYSMFMLPKLLYASPAWLSSLSLIQHHQLEQVQKRAVRLILGSQYTYQEALHTLHLTTLQARHAHFLEKFAKKLLHHPRHRNTLMLAASPPRHSIRHTNTLISIRVRMDRYKKSAVPAHLRW